MNEERSMLRQRPSNNAPAMPIKSSRTQQRAAPPKKAPASVLSADGGAQQRTPAGRRPRPRAGRGLTASPEDLDDDGGNASLSEFCESASLSFTYRKKRQARMEEMGGSRQKGQLRLIVEPLTDEVRDDPASPEADGDCDAVSCVSGFSGVSASSKGSQGSRASAVSRTSRTSAASTTASSQAGKRPPPPPPGAYVREPPRDVARNSLYLLKARLMREEIKFAGGMGHEQCAKFYRTRKLDYVLERPAQQAQAQRPSPQAAAQVQAPAPPAMAAMSPAKRKMIERLRKMELRRQQEQALGAGGAVAKRRPNDAAAPKDIDDSSNSTLSTIGLDESLGSLDNSKHSVDGFMHEGGDNSKSTLTSEGGARRRPRFSISFHSTVYVHRIPAAQSYPRKTFETVWYNKSEWTAQKKAARLELMSDGSDWRTATEEGDYVQCPQTRKKVHPVHVKGLSEARRASLGRNPLKLLATPPPPGQRKKSPKKGATAA